MAASDRNPVVYLMGPTATGKTDIALHIAERYAVRIISVDSALVYRGMDIGTAKPGRDVLECAPHHLIDIRDPAERYSAADFCADALAEIEQAEACGELPLLVGGTMLYFRALRDGLADMPAASPEVRARIESQAEREGWPAIHARLAEVDPETAGRLKPTDSQRLQRALEVFETTGTPLSEWHQRQSASGLQRRIFQFGLMPDARGWLHARIARRFATMCEAGFLDEMRGLHARDDLNAELPSMRCVGYRQFWQHLEGELSFDEATAAAIAATRQLAKRQITWLRSWEGLLPVDVSENATAGELAGRLISTLQAQGIVLQPRSDR